MTGRVRDFDDPDYWIKNAEGDLAMARAKVPGASVEHHCFHAQQTAEKALKAVSVARGLSFQFTHNINNLLRDLQKQGVKVPDSVSVARDLSVYAVETRYVGIEDPSQTKLKEAIRAARITLNWAKKEVARAQTDSPQR